MCPSMNRQWIQRKRDRIPSHRAGLVGKAAGTGGHAQHSSSLYDELVERILKLGSAAAADFEAQLAKLRQQANTTGTALAELAASLRVEEQEPPAVPPCSKEHR